jgi:hypothetical protein
MPGTTVSRGGPALQTFQAFAFSAAKYTALKFAPETGRLVDAIGMKNWHFRGHREPVFHSVFIQFSIAGLEAIERK